MRITKDQIFHRTRAFNIVQMTDFLFHRLSRYYEVKLLDASHNRLRSLLKFKKFAQRQNEKIEKMSSYIFTVDSSTGAGSYQVDSLACTCTCVIGQNGKPCKHQFWVAESEELD